MVDRTTSGLCTSWWFIHTTMLWALALHGCSSEPGAAILVRTSQVPALTDSLQVLVTLNEVLASEAPILEPDGRTDFSFVLRLPSGASGRLGLWARAIRADGCTIAAGTSAESIAPFEIEVVTSLVLVPESSGAVHCGRGSPLIDHVEPSVASTEGKDLAGNDVELTIRGWGFQPGSTVLIAGMPSPRSSWRSPVELRATVPRQPGHSGPASFTVTNPDGMADSRGDIFKYFLTIGFAAFSSQFTWVHDLKAADLNGDGMPDLALLHDGINGPELLVLLSHDGAFAQAPDVYALTFAEGQHELKIGDLDNDGMPDVIINNHEAVSIFFNRGQGLFPPLPTDYPVAVLPRSVALGDVDGDGDIDLVMVGNGVDPAPLLLFLNQGKRSFVLSAASVKFALGPSPIRALALRDLNNDGRQDMVALGTPPEKVSIYLNQGGGVFPASPLSYPVGKDPNFVSLEDLNGDGYLDLTVAGSNNLSVHLNQGAGTFAMAGDPYPAGTQGLAMADLNGDGLIDIALSCRDGVKLLLNDGHGIFVTKQISTTSSQRIAAADFDGDKRIDLAFLTPDDGAVQILVNTSQ